MKNLKTIIESNLYKISSQPKWDNAYFLPIKQASTSVPIFGSTPVGKEARKRFESKPKRKLSLWQEYIKNKRNHIKYRDGKLNLKKMGVEFRRKKRR